ncbi:MAG TPA: MEDS domain-containing protein [Terriglobales bacterium]|nr:MEDS domain-containing protein [Terriglobales bacterium]
MSSLPAVHSVHFYENHGALIERLCGIVSSSLLIGNSVLLVCSEEHRVDLVGSLERLQVDVRDHARQGRFSMFDASEMLSMFMVDGRPDEHLFLASVGKVLAEAKKAARSKHEGLTVFGEMVAVLWEKGNKAGAVALEKLWNRAMQRRAFHLHCAYPSRLFEEDEAELQEIYRAHTHVVGDARAHAGTA